MLSIYAPLHLFPFPLCEKIHNYRNIPSTACNVINPNQFKSAKNDKFPSNFYLI